MNIRIHIIYFILFFTISIHAQSVFDEPIPLAPSLGGGMSIDANALKKYDAIVRTTKDPISKFIRLATWATITHVGLYLGNNLIIDITNKGIREIPIDEFLGESTLVVAYRCSKSFNNKKIDEYLARIKNEGTKFNYIGLFFHPSTKHIICPLMGILSGAGQEYTISTEMCKKVTGFIEKHGISGTLFCSELFFTAFKEAGIDIVNPHESKPQDIVEVEVREKALFEYIGHLKIPN